MDLTVPWIVVASTASHVIDSLVNVAVVQVIVVKNVIRRVLKVSLGKIV